MNKRDSVANAVSEYVQTVNKAANVFLNRQLSAAERLKAIAPYPFIYEPKQVDEFKKIVLSNEETPEIRAMALNKIYQNAEDDEPFLNRMIELFGNTATPKPLRNETFNLVGNLSFSSLVGVLDVYHKMIEDPNLNFRSFAASKLLLAGDARAQQLLIKGLENPQSALFTPTHAIELLSLSPKKEFYPAVYKILLESRDESARLIAVQTLGAYKPAREKLIAISQSPNEKENFRESALMALYSGDKDNIINYVTPILLEKSASDRLQLLGMQMATDVRRTMSYRKSKKAAKADDFDRLIKNIYERKGLKMSDEILSKANEYLLLVKPNF